MPTAKKTDHTLRCLLSAERVETDLGIIRGCTVAKSGVVATGKVVLLDKAGMITQDEELCAKRLPVYTDEKTLSTLMAAASAAGPRVKTREDHDDSIGARAGFADAFKLAGDRVVADIHLFASYRNRDVVLDTANATPDEIGLSIDMKPVFEIAGDKAMMRIEKLYAVDIVDEGAITPGGLLLSAGVDTEEKERATEKNSANTTTDMPPTNEEIMNALGNLTKTVGECMAQMSKLAAPAAPAGDGDELKAQLKAVREDLGKLTASAKETAGQLASIKKERALLGFRGTPGERAQLAASGTAEDIEQLNAKKKDYLTLVREYAAANKCLLSAAHGAVQKTDEGRAAYRLHLSARGVTGRETMAA
jgi:hypothetical protein